GHLRGIATFLVALLPLALAVFFARRFTGRHIRRLEALDLASMPVRTTLLLAHLLQVACTAASLWVAPQLAVLLVRDLPESVKSLVTGIGTIAALCWLGLGVSRELLRPKPAARLILKVDPATARRVGKGTGLLLAWSLVALSLQHALTELGY